MIETLVLSRFCDSPEMGVFGELRHEDQLLAYTIEQPWNNNQPFKSCIPAGTYRFERHDSPKYPGVLALVNPALGVFHYPQDRDNERDRYACLLHPANFVDDVEGCIGPGAALGASGGRWMVTRSRETLREILDLIHDPSQWQVHIEWRCGQ